MTCAATLARSDSKDWRDARLRSVICLSHAEDSAIRATRGVAHHHSVAKHSEADDSFLAVVLAQVFRFERRACKEMGGILKIEASLLDRFGPLRRIVGDGHLVRFATKYSSTAFRDT